MRLAIPEQLPIAAHVETISAALRDHQVVIVAGETGSGKTTQLPKIALAAGRGTMGMIGHTQPRRIAARTLAARIAEECGVELGAEVGFAVRFTDRTAKGTKVKVMTDGILLAELQRDRDLRRYDTIIIDEAHERSLNIDFLLGYLTRLLPRRPDLRVDRHQRPRSTWSGSRRTSTARPIIEVSGRTYPVDVRYRPRRGRGLRRRGRRRRRGPGVPDLRHGDVLVFCPGSARSTMSPTRCGRCSIGRPPKSCRCTPG